MIKTKQQKLAEAEARAARIRHSIRADDTRQKIVTGNAVIALALSSPPAAEMVLAAFDTMPLLERDQKVIHELVSRLRVVAKGSE